MRRRLLFRSLASSGQDDSGFNARERVLEKKIHILDGNFRQEPSLGDWLRHPHNFVALTDISAIEIYKGSEPRSMLWSLKLLKDHAEKVIVLKPTQEILRLPGIEKGLRRRLIDHPGTAHYPSYCLALHRMENDPSIREQVVERQQWANEEVHRMKAGLADYAGAVKELSAEFSPDEKRLIKSATPYPRDMAFKILDGVSKIALHQYSRVNPKAPRLVGPIYNLMVFRYALCAFLLALQKVADGGNVSQDLDKLVNDGYDMSYCAYATYFDGLFTNDRQSMMVYGEASVVLRGIRRALGN
ncbi:hypothetical protein RKE25_02700 [Dyella sp. BiH032]|uniref:hypothetical protein n=1 Tax=Dyella sp. BiH032 TaxID=3075430 RepID=UPI00289378AB|nr:hypothetical protein [Dyella sp. BiH032]WNL46564.1 hypothetical protein RKE25_02700 [Dyella sp. BiH032]